MIQNNNILQELTGLNSSLAGMERKNPYVVPEGYFEDLLPRLMQRIRAMEAENVSEEIEALSPFLAGLKKEMPFRVPAGYFENISVPGSTAPQAKVVSFSPHKWFRYAAAVVITGLLAVAAITIWNNNFNAETMPYGQFTRKLSKEIDKMSDLELTEFIQYSDAGLTGEEKVSITPNNDIKELLEDIPVTELKEFIEETSDLDTEEVLMN